MLEESENDVVLYLLSGGNEIKQGTYGNQKATWKPAHPLTTSSFGWFNCL